MPIVVDSGPLIALAKLSHLHLLSRLYGQLLVPHAVHDEVVVAGRERGYPDADLIADYLTREDCVPVPAPGPPPVLGEGDHAREGDLPAAGRPDLRSLRLGTGETQALTLALGQGLPLAIDDSRARQAARDLGLQTVGTLGVLVAACARGHIGVDALSELLATIERRDDIWIDAELCRRVRRQLASGDLPFQHQSEA